jgi:hypothetical protein
MIFTGLVGYLSACADDTATVVSASNPSAPVMNLCSACGAIWTLPFATVALITME